MQFVFIYSLLRQMTLPPGYLTSTRANSEWLFLCY